MTLQADNEAQEMQQCMAALRQRFTEMEMLEAESRRATDAKIAEMQKQMSALVGSLTITSEGHKRHRKAPKLQNKQVRKWKRLWLSSKVEVLRLFWEQIQNRARGQNRTT